MDKFSRKYRSIARDIEQGLSTDDIVDKHSNKRLDNTDDILKIVRHYKWEQRIRYGRRV
jgi:hypothetical protein|tara:strand:+ start:2081 stop:2257 length:177 start_codon:yes stop_codon:yes gene_type:complete